MLPVLQVGPLAVQLPGLVLLAGVWLGMSLVERHAPRRDLSGAQLTNMVVYALVAGIVGARLGYGLRFVSVYLNDPLGLLSLNPSTLSAPDGLVAGLVVAVIYAQRAGLPLWPTLDALTPGLAVFAVALGLAHLASGDAFGAPTALPWAIELWGARRHPSQVYETLSAGLLLVAVVRLDRSRAPSGLLFLTWTGLTSLSRLLLEAFRGDSLIVFGSLRLAQLLSLGVLLVVMFVAHLRARGALSSAEPVAESG